MKLPFASLLITAAATRTSTFAASAQEFEPPLRKTDAIAIVGAGPAGLFAARKLAELGYKHVTVFEAGDRVAATAETVDFNGKVYDLTTRFVNPYRPDDSTLPSRVAAVFDELEVPLEPIDFDVSFFDLDSQQKLMTVFELPAFQGADLQYLVPQLIEGALLLVQVALAGDATSCCELASQSCTETWAQFEERVQLPLFTTLAKLGFELFTGGPAVKQLACYVLATRAHFQLLDIAALLAFLLQGNEEAIAGLPKELKDFVLNPKAQASGFRRFQSSIGYQAFFDALAASTGAKLLLNSAVEIVRPLGSSGRIQDRTDKPPFRHTFRAVIVTANPSQAADMLDSSYALKLLLEQAEGKTHFSSLYPATGPESLIDGFFTLPGIANYGLNAFELFTDSTTGVQFDGQAAIAFGYENGAGSPTEARIVVELERLGLTVDSPSITFVSKQSSAVVDPAVLAGCWYEQIAAAQGDGGVFYAGQLVAGYGVPAVENFATNNVLEWFGQE